MTINSHIAYMSGRAKNNEQMHLFLSFKGMPTYCTWLQQCFLIVTRLITTLGPFPETLLLEVGDLGRGIVLKHDSASGLCLSYEQVNSLKLGSN